MVRMPSSPPPEQTATITAALNAAGRPGKAVPIRRTFLQQGTQRKPQPGPLQKIVQRHDDTALDLYLLLMAGASSSPVGRHSRLTRRGRAIGHRSDVDGGRSIVSKAGAH